MPLSDKGHSVSTPKENVSETERAETGDATENHKKRRIVSREKHSRGLSLSLRSLGVSRLVVTKLRGILVDKAETKWACDLFKWSLTPASDISHIT